MLRKGAAPPPEAQGLTLGVIQSMAALARAVGPPMGGIAYEVLGMRGPYFIGAAGLLAVFVLSYRLAPIRPRERTAVDSGH
jgi:MFS family permease